MGEQTKIEWCDHTFNPWRGCTKVSAGCANCYAERDSKRNPSVLGIWGQNGTRVVASEAMWKQPLKWNAEAQAAGVRRRVFCASLADVFETWTRPIHTTEKIDDGDGGGNAVAWHRDDIGVCRAGQCSVGNVCGERLARLDDLRLRLMRLIVKAPHLDWLLLTKRPENIEPWLIRLANRISTYEAEEFSAAWKTRIWLGVSVEDQATADARIPILLTVPAAVRFLSCEPLLAPVDLTKWMPAGVANWQCGKCGGFFAERGHCPHCSALMAYASGSHAGNKRDPTNKFTGSRNGQPIDWVIAGGESGPHARPMHPDWARSLRDQCTAAGVAFNFKQWGEYHTTSSLIGTGEAVFRQFNSYEHWVAKASTWVNGGVCLDRLGNRLEIGAHFMAARDQGRFPVTIMQRVGKKTAGRLLDGREWNQFPEAAR